MAKLTGTNPDQVPTNADLGDMAYKDGENLQAGPLTIKDGKVGVGTTSPSSKLQATQTEQSTTAIFENTNASWANDVSFKYAPSGSTSSDFSISNRSNGSIWLGSGYGPIHFQLDENENNSRSTKVIIQSNGDVDITNELIAGSYNETYSALSGTSPTVNCEAGNAFSLTLSGNTTFTFSNPPASGTAYSFSIEIIQDASASGFTVTWPASVDWPSATAPTLTATASAKDVFIFTTRDAGVTWYGFTAGQALG